IGVEQGAEVLRHPGHGEGKHRAASTEAAPKKVPTGLANVERQALSATRTCRTREAGLAGRLVHGRSHPPLLLRLPKSGGTVRPSAGDDAAGDRLRGWSPAQAPVALPGRN